MDCSTLVVETDQHGVATLTVNRPEARNALSGKVLNELADFLSNNRGFTGLILTGAPGPAFIAGADIKEMAAMTPDEGASFGALGQRVTRLLEEAPFPVVACVDGYALGGGCEMVLACDFAYATTRAVLGQPEVLLGLVPGFGGCVRLQRLVGPAVARDLVYTGRHVDANEALRLGLVAAVFAEREEMLSAARATLHRVARNSPRAVALAKAAMNGSRGTTVDAGLGVELAAFRTAFTTHDMREGTAAFLAKRPPAFARPRCLQPPRSSWTSASPSTEAAGRTSPAAQPQVQKPL